MEHEVFVPVPVERLREALGDPHRVARAVPGLQQDAGADPVAGRLKVRFGSHSITYRGTVRVSTHPDGSYAVEGDATEARGTGSVKLALTLRLRDTDDGTALTVDGTATADGRVTELPAETVSSALTRLLNRFAENLGAFEDEPSVPEAVPEPEPVPVLEEFTEPEEPPAEAAHARRTMIGRSAEEVDHAPPRGRYAPVPAPQTVAAGTTLRWAAPAAALVLASAIVVGRALRKRR
ncbi:SRPBCC domain-containing protein [Streptomyces sp. NPDC047072]|uniref:SRPBCC domain-containing protein n=1 Tax=Streptomyces sp. NPDC047072 TaxID=3154809 RepID=UPI0033FC86B0